MAFDQSKADLICERLAEGESLNAICKTEGFPAESTVRLWALDDVQGFAAKYARAREVQAHTLFEEIRDIADTPVIGVRTKTNEKGEVETTEGDMIEHRRLQVDARKWFLSKVLPKVYGDKLDLNHSGYIATPKELTEQDLERIATTGSVPAPK